MRKSRKVIHIRKKPRGTGKTTDVIDMAEALVEMGRTVMVVLPKQHFIRDFKHRAKHLLVKNKYQGQLLLTPASTAEQHARGRTIQYVIVDDSDLIPEKTLNELVYAVAPTGPKFFYITS